MKKIVIAIMCFSLAVISLTSCVAKRKYVAARSRASQAVSDNMALNTRVSGLQDTVSYLHNRITEMNGRIGALGNANENAANELNMTKDQVAAQRKRLNELETFLNQQQKASEDLKKKLTDALVGFNSSDLTISLKDGRVYVSMEEALLFPSGSAKVNPRGKDALAKLATVLNTNPDINIDIDGNTDNVPIHTKLYEDNWALSVARATAIARILIGEYGVSPTRLMASGHSHYNPVASNDNVDSRALNRRTDIILEPKYDELMELMNAPGNMADK